MNAPNSTSTQHITFDYSAFVSSIGESSHVIYNSGEILNDGINYSDTPLARPVLHKKQKDKPLSGYQKFVTKYHKQFGVIDV